MNIADDIANAYAHGYTEAEAKYREMMKEQSEEKKGKWIDGRCNKCGAHAPFWSMSTTYYQSNFCPECGCYMRDE